VTQLMAGTVRGRGMETASEAQRKLVRAEDRTALRAVPEHSSLAALTEKAQDYIGASKAPATVRVYRIAWADFTTWCATHGQPSLPASPQTVALYLTTRADTLKVASLGLYLSGISQAHQVAGFASPAKDTVVRLTMAGIKRTKGTAQEAKAPTVTADIRRMVDALPANRLGTRDRALLLLGFAGAFRRSELVALDREDLAITSEGVTVTLRRSKTDQEGQGRKVGIPYGSNPATCPVRALQAWLEASGIEAGPLFRGLNRHGQLLPGRLSDRSVARVVQRQAEAVGLDPAKYGGHSLRAGHATSAAQAGASERAIMNQTGHKTESMVRRYIREGSLFRENSAMVLGL
jgi:integrase